MKKAIMILLLATFSWLFCVQSADEAKIIMVLFDTSKSMVGYGDGKGINILPKVKNTALKAITKNLKPNDLFVFLPFSDGVINADLFEMEVRNNYDIKAANLLIQNIQAKGMRTSLSKSILQALNKLQIIKDDKKHSQKKILQLYVFTDGIGNGKGDKGKNAFKEFLKKYKILKSKYGYLFSKFIILDNHGFSDDIIKKLKNADIKIQQTNRLAINNNKFNVELIKPLKKDKSQNVVLQNENKEKTNVKQNKANDITVKNKKKAKKIRLIDKVYFVKNYGEITLLLANEFDDFIETEFKVVNNNKFIQYKIKHPVKLVTNREVDLEILPVDKKKLKKLRDEIKNSRIIKLKIEPISKDENYYYSPKYIQVKVIVNKSFGIKNLLW